MTIQTSSLITFLPVVVIVVAAAIVTMQQFKVQKQYVRIKKNENDPRKRK